MVNRMNIKVMNGLEKADFTELASLLSSGDSDEIELLPEIDLGFAKSSKLMIHSQEQGYSMTIEMQFEDPIGNGVWVHEDIPCQSIERSAREIKLNLSRFVVDPNELANDLKRVLALMEEAMNYACVHREEESNV